MFRIVSPATTALVALACTAATSSAQADGLLQHAAKSYLVDLNPGVALAACSAYLLQNGFALRTEALNPSVLRLISNDAYMAQLVRNPGCVRTAQAEVVTDQNGRSSRVVSVIVGMQPGTNIATCKAALRKAGFPIQKLPRELNIESTGMISVLAPVHRISQLNSRTVSCVAFAEPELIAGPSPSTRVGN